MRLIRAASAAAVLLTVIIGLPAALVHLGHWPLTGLPSTEQWRDLPNDHRCGRRQPLGTGRTPPRRRHALARALRPQPRRTPTRRTSLDRPRSDRRRLDPPAATDRTAPRNRHGGGERLRRRTRRH